MSQANTCRLCSYWLDGHPATPEWGWCQQEDTQKAPQVVQGKRCVGRAGLETHHAAVCRRFTPLTVRARGLE